MAKPTVALLFIILIIISDKALCQEDRYSLELHHGGSTVVKRFGSGIWIGSERSWNIEFDSDSVIFEGIGYKIQENDTLLRHYLSEMENIIRNNDFIFTRHDPGITLNGMNIDGICLDGVSIIGTIAFGPETKVFLIRSCFYVNNPLHRNLLDCFFNISNYLLAETPISGKIESITYWQLAEFEQNSSLRSLPYRKVSDVPLKYRFYSYIYKYQWDTAWLSIQKPNMPIIIEVDDSFRILAKSQYASETLYSPLQEGFLNDLDQIQWHVYSSRTKRYLMKLGVNKHKISFIGYPKMGNNEIPKEAKIYDWDNDDFIDSKLGRSSKLE